jgi:hypothetical protein
VTARKSARLETFKHVRVLLVAWNTRHRALFLTPPLNRVGNFDGIATALLGAALPQNVSRKTREGWEPVKALDHPELMLAGDKNGNVELGGLILCKMPEELVDSRNNFYRKQNASQMESVDNNFMRQSDPRMPLFSEKKSSTTRGVGFGNGSK